MAICALPKDHHAPCVISAVTVQGEENPSVQAEELQKSCFSLQLPNLKAWRRWAGSSSRACNNPAKRQRVRGAARPGGSHPWEGSLSSQPANNTFLPKMNRPPNSFSSYTQMWADGWGQGLHGRRGASSNPQARGAAHQPGWVSPVGRTAESHSCLLSFSGKFASTASTSGCAWGRLARKPPSPHVFTPSLGIFGNFLSGHHTFCFLLGSAFPCHWLNWRQHAAYLALQLPHPVVILYFQAPVISLLRLCTDLLTHASSQSGFRHACLFFFLLYFFPPLNRKLHSPVAHSGNNLKNLATGI